MRPIARLKASLRPTPIYQPFLWRKEARQEKIFFGLREHYYRLNPDAFSQPGYLVRSHDLLRSRWRGPGQPKASRQAVRIFVIDKPGMDGPWFESELARSFDTVTFSMARHKRLFLSGATDLASRPLGVDPAEQFNPGWGSPNSAWRAQLQRDILATVAAAHAERPIDLLFAYGTLELFAPETLQAIRGWSIPVALLCLDDKHAFLEQPLGYPNGQKPLIGSCDVHLTNSLDCVRWYMAEGSAAYYFPQASDPQLYEFPPAERDIPISFVGQAYGARFAFIKSLLRFGVPLECFGPGWKNGRVHDRTDVFRRSLISLGLGSTGYMNRMSCIKGRDFEVPSSGCLYITSYDPELASLFHVGKEIVCYRNEVDCVEQIRYYLAHKDEARAIGAAGRARCLTDHTWTNRMEGLLRWMGILEGATSAAPAPVPSPSHPAPAPSPSRWRGLG